MGNFGSKYNRGQDECDIFGDDLSLGRSIEEQTRRTEQRDHRSSQGDSKELKLMNHQLITFDN